jgi:hypothetical protein
MPSWLMVEKDLFVPTAADAIILSECCKDRNNRQLVLRLLNYSIVEYRKELSHVAQRQICSRVDV